jgi:uncharacterized protein
VIVVLDTNVLLSALFFRSGLSSAVLRYAISITELVSSPWLVNEFTTKLNSPDFRKKNRNYQFDDVTIGQLTAFVQQSFRLVTPTNALPTLCRDADDNHVLQLAEFVGADYLITGDKDLLVLDPFGPCRIVSPKTFAGLVGLVKPD